MFLSRVEGSKHYSGREVWGMQRKEKKWKEDLVKMGGDTWI